MNGVVLFSKKLGPGLVPVGFAEDVLARVPEVDDPALIWDGATTLAAMAQKWNGHGKEKTEIKCAQMFLEVELGQRLGPNPGIQPGPGRGNKNNPHADCFEDIPPQRVEELRRFHGHRDLLIEAIRDGTRSRRALLLLLDGEPKFNQHVEFGAIEKWLRDRMKSWPEQLRPAFPETLRRIAELIEEDFDDG